MRGGGRKARERATLDVISQWPIRTQTELVQALQSRGFQVTQATVSRDIQRLGVVKRGGGGGARYVRPGADAPAPVTQRVLRTALREFAIQVEPGEALLAIRTQSGCANAVAVAIDEAEMDGVVATLAGDDTIFVMLESAPDRARILSKLRAFSEI